MNKYQKATLAHALTYAKRGWHVLPTKKNKQPLNSNGSRGATTDEVQIRAWWETHPNANIGIATGQISGFFVVDVDIKNDKDGIAILKKHFGDEFILSEGDLMQRTPSGGYHFLFQCPEEPIANAQGVLEGIDIRGEGGYILAAPSSVCLNDEWLEYRWNDPNYTIPAAPDWVMRLVAMSGSGSQRKVDLNQAVTTGLSEGQRDESIFKIACLLERAGVDPNTAEAFIWVVADKCQPPFDPAVAAEKVERVYREYASSKGLELRIAQLKQLREST